MTLHPLYAQTPGAGGWGDRAAEPATPQGGRAGLGCRAAVGVSPPAVQGILPRHAGPLLPALRRELETSCTWQSSSEADMDASLSHQQPHLFVH